MILFYTRDIEVKVSSNKQHFSVSVWRDSPFNVEHVDMNDGDQTRTRPAMQKIIDWLFSWNFLFASQQLSSDHL